MLVPTPRLLVLAALITTQALFAQTTAPVVSGQDFNYIFTMFMRTGNPQHQLSDLQRREAFYVEQLGLSGDEAKTLHSLSLQFRQSLADLTAQAVQAGKTDGIDAARRASILATQRQIVLQLGSQFIAAISSDAAKLLHSRAEAGAPVN